MFIEQCRKSLSTKERKELFERHRSQLVDMELAFELKIKQCAELNLEYCRARARNLGLEVLNDVMVQFSDGQTKCEYRGLIVEDSAFRLSTKVTILLNQYRKDGKLFKHVSQYDADWVLNRDVIRMVASDE